MRIFRLDRKAYHSLETHFEVSISESGHLVNSYDSRVSYFIRLDEKAQAWVYCRYLKTRTEYREFLKDNKYYRCRVFANFEQVSKFNR